MTIPAIMLLPVMLAAVGYIVRVVCVTIPRDLREEFVRRLDEIRFWAADEVRSGKGTPDAIEAVRLAEVLMDHAGRITATNMLVTFGALYTARVTSETEQLDRKLSEAVERARAGAERPLTGGEGPYMTAIAHAVIGHVLYGTPVGWTLNFVSKVTGRGQGTIAATVDSAVRHMMLAIAIPRLWPA